MTTLHFDFSIQIGGKPQLYQYVVDKVLEWIEVKDELDVVTCCRWLAKDENVKRLDKEGEEWLRANPPEPYVLDESKSAPCVKCDRELYIFQWEKDGKTYYDGRVKGKACEICEVKGMDS
jgi:hypothetical protein